MRITSRRGEGIFRLLFCWMLCLTSTLSINPRYIDGERPVSNGNGNRAIFPESGSVATFSEETAAPAKGVPQPPFTDFSDGGAFATPSSSTNGPYLEGSNSGTTAGQSPNGLEILVAIFFFVAAAWLLIAVFYALLALLVLRLRANGRLDIYDEQFGRFYVLGTRFFVPCGCILRRYVVAFGHDQSRNGRRHRSDYRYISRSERRSAIQKILIQEKSCNKKKKQAIDQDEEIGNMPVEKNQSPVKTDAAAPLENGIDTSSDHSHSQCSEGPVCSICLAEYGDDKNIFKSNVCDHMYHSVCILDWLERRSNTDCPCCRRPLVSDTDIWEMVKKVRKAKQKHTKKKEKKESSQWLRSSNSSALPHQDYNSNSMDLPNTNSEIGTRNAHHQRNGIADSGHDATMATFLAYSGDGSYDSARDNEECEHYETCSNDMSDERRQENHHRHCNGDVSMPSLSSEQEQAIATVHDIETPLDDYIHGLPSAVASDIESPYDDQRLSDISVDAGGKMPREDSPKIEVARGSRDPEGVHATRGGGSDHSSS